MVGETDLVLFQETCSEHLSPVPGQQVKLKQITPRTEEEKTEHSVAAERRRLRLVYADTIKGLLANCAIQEGERPTRGGAVSCLSLCWAPTGQRGREPPKDSAPGGLRPG